MYCCTIDNTFNVIFKTVGATHPHCNIYYIQGTKKQTANK